MSTKIKLELLKKYIKELIKKELDEAVADFINCRNGR